MAKTKMIYYFGKSKTDGAGDMKALLGGKGADKKNIETIVLITPTIVGNNG